VTEYLIKLCAFHEVLELLFIEVRALCPPKKTELLDKELHKVIRALENTIFKEYVEKNKPTI